MRTRFKLTWILSSTALLMNLIAGPVLKTQAAIWQPRTIDQVTTMIQYSPNQDQAYYQVQWGDTLSIIAQAVGLTTQEIAALNMIDHPDFIHEGAILYFDAVDHTVTYYEEETDTVTISTETGASLADDYTERVEDFIETVGEEEILAEDSEPVWVDLSSHSQEEAEEIPFEPVALEEEQVQESVPQALEEELAPIFEESLNQEPLPTEEDVVATVEEEEIQVPIDQEWAEESQDLEEVSVVEENFESPVIEEESFEEAISEEAIEEETFEEETLVEEVLEDVSLDEAPIQEEEPAGRAIEVEATAYSRHEAGLGDLTASGIDLSQNPSVIAVDPSVIPLGSTVYIPGYGTFVAGDTGGAIIGNRIDVHLEDVSALSSFGRQNLTVYVLH